MRQVLQGTYPLMSIMIQLPGPLLSGAWGPSYYYFSIPSLQIYVDKNKAAKIGDIVAGHLSFEVS